MSDDIIVTYQLFDKIHTNDFTHKILKTQSDTQQILDRYIRHKNLFTSGNADDK